VDGVVFSSEVGRRKPAPEVYQAALDTIATRAEETLFVGDRLREDYEGPLAAGMRAVILTKHSGGTQEVMGVLTIASLTEVPGLL
jgi:putative hydrolase of the HAD superfamily